MGGKGAYKDFWCVDAGDRGGGGRHGAFIGVRGCTKAVMKVYQAG